MDRKIGDRVEGYTSLRKSDEEMYQQSKEEEDTESNTGHEFLDKGSKYHGYGTLIAVAFAYLLVFVGYVGTEALQTHINSEAGLGTTTIAIVYGSFFLSCFGFGPVVLGKFGPKWCIVLGWIFYALFIAANFYPRAWTLYPTAAAIGLGGSVVWIGMSIYITSLAIEHSKKTKKELDKTLSLFNGIFMGIMFFQYAISAFISAVVFYVADLNPPEENEIQTLVRINTSHVIQDNVQLSELSYRFNNNNNNNTDVDEHGTVCGSGYCSYLSTHVEQLNKPDDVFIYINIGIFLLCVILGMIILSFQRAVLPPDHEPMKIKTRLYKLVCLLKEPNWLLIAPTYALVGFMQGLSVNTFSQAYINCAVNIRWVAYVLTVRGMTYMITCFLSGKLMEYLPRWTILLVSYLLEMAVLITWLLITPNADKAWVFFVVQGFEGIASSSVRVQSTALVGYMFPSDQEIAFAHVNMAIALPTSLIMAAANFLCFDHQAYIAIAMVGLSMIGYLILHFRLRKKDGIEEARNKDKKEEATEEEVTPIKS